MSAHPTSPPPAASDGRTSLSLSDEGSLIDELSFAYEIDSNGKHVRVSHDSTKEANFPPTPPDGPYNAQVGKQSPTLQGRGIGSRMDGPARVAGAGHAKGGSDGQDGHTFTAQPGTSRSFVRVNSGPAGSNAVHRPMRVPRITMEKHEEAMDDYRSRQTSAADVSANGRWSPSSAPAQRYGTRPASVAGYGAVQPTKRSPPNTKLITRRPERVARDAQYYNNGPASAPPIENEGYDTDNGDDAGAPNGRHRNHGMLEPVPPSSFNAPTRRPRRSASFSEQQLDDPLPVHNQGATNRPSMPPKRAQSSLETYQPRRAMRSQQHEDIDPLDFDKDYRESQPFPQPPSPTHPQQPLARPPYGHSRKDSETLRTIAASQSAPALDHIPQGMPSQNATAAAHQRYASGSTTGTLRARRTAPEPPNPHDPPPGIDDYGQGRQWQEVADALNGRDAKHRAYAEAPSRTLSIQPTVTAQPSAQEPSQRTPTAPALAQISNGSRQLIVNKRVYIRLDLIGKGGSSRVYRVMSDKNEICAVKRVSLDKADTDTIKGYMNEIALLKRLGNNSRIIQLLDSEARMTTAGTKGYLHLVMECGEIDLARLLQEQQKKPMNLVWIAYYWEQMLEAVHVIHEEKIVHSDLKPANFVLVKGQLKLIDFGIANAIANDTTNIQRDHQIGTVNYMSPEAIEVPEGMRRLKVGRPSDVWSLGCILYQMVYGHPPFFHLSHVVAKMRAIPDPAHVIEFPQYSTPSPVALPNAAPEELERMRRRVRRDVVASMRTCLGRNPKERATIPELLDHEWLAMKEPEAPPPPPPPPAPPVPDIHTLLASNQTIIDPFYMQQLLSYGISLGQGAQDDNIHDPEKLKQEAERLVAELQGVHAEGP